MTRRAAITSIGRSLPARVLDNKYFEQFADTNDEWIRTRTGIVTRHHAEKGTGSSVLATLAARECLERRGTEPKVVPRSTQAEEPRMQCGMGKE